MNIFTKSNHLTAKAKKAFNGIDPISDCAARVYFNDSARADLICEMLESMGNVRTMETPYNTFRGSRNLSGRDIHVTEFLYLVRKKL